MAMRKRPSYKDPEPARRAKFKTAGPGASSKTRPDVPATRERKAATGKQVRRGKG